MGGEGLGGRGLEAQGALDTTVNIIQSTTQMMTNPAAAQVNPIHAAANAMAGAAANAMAGAAANLVTQRPPFRTASLLNTTRNLQPQNPTTMHMGFYNGHLHYDIAVR